MSLEPIQQRTHWSFFYLMSTSDITVIDKSISIGRASLVFILRDVTRFHAIIGSLGTVRAQPRFRSHVKSMGDFRLLQITVI